MKLNFFVRKANLSNVSRSGNGGGGGGFTPTPAQQQAIDSGITSEILSDIETDIDNLKENLANFIGNFDSYAELVEYSGTLTNNDYAVVGQDETHSNECWRYVYNADIGLFVAQYKINETPINTIDQASNPTDTDSLSDLNGTTNKRWTFARIWNWILDKISGICEKGIQISGGKLGHSNSVTSPATSARFICGVLDEQGHFKGTPIAFQYSSVYSSDLENCLFTRTGAKNLYDFVKIKDASGGNAVLTTGMDSALTRTSGSHQSTVSRVMKYCGVVSLQYFGQYSASSAISGKFTCIGSVPADYKPVSQVAIQVTTWNSTPAGCASGYVTSDGKIYVWVSSITSGATNIQFVINATWKGA